MFLQPEIVFEDMNSLSEADREAARITRDWYAPGREDVMRQARPELSGLFKEAGIPFTEIGEIADPAHKDKALYVDYTHLTPDGSKLVAAKMMPVVAERIAQCENGA